MVSAIRAAVGPDFLMILRVSQWKQQDFEARLAATPDELEQWLQPLVEAGVDIVHASQRRFRARIPRNRRRDRPQFRRLGQEVTGAPTIASARSASRANSSRPSAGAVLARGVRSTSWSTGWSAKSST